MRLQRLSTALSSGTPANANNIALDSETVTSLSDCISHRMMIPRYYYERGKRDGASCTSHPVGPFPTIQERGSTRPARSLCSDSRCDDNDPLRVGL
jgi:hypothetical protein